MSNNYSDTTKSHLNMLVQLAKVDGIIVREEIDLIKKVGIANGMSLDEISESFKNPLHTEIGESISDDLRFEYMYNIVQLMKIDGRLYNEEIEYCAKVASKLGYDKNVLSEMILKIYSDPHISSDKKSLKKIIQTYLKK